MFADDCLIFINASSASAGRLNEILRLYKGASGQRVNRDKSSVFFSPSTSNLQKEAVKNELDIYF